MMRDQFDAGMRQHFQLFLMRVFRHLHPGKPPLHLAWYVKAICHALTQAAATPGARLVISIPPRHLKSIAAAVALPAWLLGLDPTRKFMVATYSERLARQHSLACRAIMTSDWYKRLFPRTRIADSGNTIDQITTTQGGGRIAVTVGGTVTGLGADVVIVDDCLKPDNARSDTMREAARDWFDGTLSTRLNSPGQGSIISIAQRLHEDDLPAHLLEKGYGHLCLPAVAVKREDVPIGPGIVYRREPGGLLDHPDFPKSVLDTLRREQGSQVYSAQQQQDPVAPEGNLIPWHWFGVTDEPPTRDECGAVVQSWDTAQSEEPGADYSVCTTWGYFEKHWHLLHVLRERLAFPDLRRAVLAQHQIWRPTKIVIEDAGTGRSLWDELKHVRGLRPRMWSVTKDKVTRLVGVSARIEAGLCVLPDQAPWLDAYRSEFKVFPYGRHDDQVDSTVQFLEFAREWEDWLLTERDADGRVLRIRRPEIIRPVRFGSYAR